jgi:hypothetical protein
LREENVDNLEEKKVVVVVVVLLVLVIVVVETGGLLRDKQFISIILITIGAVEGCIQGTPGLYSRGD